MRGLLLVSTAIGVLSACAMQEPAPSLVTQCETPRPQVCTMEYAPVCGQLSGGGSKEFASGCNACGNENVEGYLPGPCPTESN